MKPIHTRTPAIHRSASFRSRRARPGQTTGSSLIFHLRLPKRPVILAALAALPLAKANDQESTRFIEPSLYDTLWSKAVLYKDDLNPVLEEFKLRGLYQGLYWDTHNNIPGKRDASASAWEDRRARFGFDAKLLDKKVEIRTEFQSNDGFRNGYNGLVDAYIRWKPNDSLIVTLGKSKPIIAANDWLLSSEAEPTFERSQIFNQLGINRATGLTVDDTIGNFSWRAGVYSNKTPNSGYFGHGEFGRLDGGVSFSLGSGYDFRHILDLERADFRVDWVHSDRRPGDLVFNIYDDIVTSTIVLKEGYAGLVIEGFSASGGDGINTNVHGFYIQPTYDIIPQKLQLVGRYTFSTGDGLAPVVAQKRYDQKVSIPAIPKVAGSKGRGKEYQAFYLGAQYFFHGDKLKLMAGAEYAELARAYRADGYDGWTLQSGISISF